MTVSTHTQRVGAVTSVGAAFQRPTTCIIESTVLPPEQLPAPLAVSIKVRPSVTLADCGIGTPVVTPSFVRAVPERSVTVSGTGGPRLAKTGVAMKTRIARSGFM